MAANYFHQLIQPLMKLTRLFIWFNMGAKLAINMSPHSFGPTSHPSDELPATCDTLGIVTGL